MIDILKYKFETDEKAKAITGQLWGFRWALLGSCVVIGYQVTSEARRFLADIVQSKAGAHTVHLSEDGSDVKAVGGY